jgi:NADH dehydrogenase [ubiquinone] 1 alpha subcomplex assembly factor 7
VRRIASRIADAGGVALIIDYGHAHTGTGNTFQAMRDNAYVDPLAKPGEADLTAHVDFGALAAAARETGGRVFGPVPQGDFLAALGIRARADRLKGEYPERIVGIDLDVDRLTHPREMGTLFKVLAVLEGTDQALPPGFA